MSICFSNGMIQRNVLCQYRGQKMKMGIKKQEIKTKLYLLSKVRRIPKTHKLNCTSFETLNYWIYFQMIPFTDPLFQTYETNSSHDTSTSSKMSSSGFQFSRSQEMFPVKLMHILQLIDTKEPELSHIISWQPNGTTFRIHDKRLFEQLVKQRGFFNQKSYSSFRRQLNLWGFKKIGKRCKADCGVYGHPLFLREYPHLCKTISRYDDQISILFGEKQNLVLRPD